VKAGWAARRRAVVSFLVVAGVMAGSVACAPPPPDIVLDLPNDPVACDPLGGEHCLLPFPNDHFTVPDRSTPTRLRVNFARESMPTTADGGHADPAEWNRNDGFSPGSAITVLLPGVDLAASGAAPITDMERYRDRDAPFVVIDTTTGRRHPVWAEIDSRAPAGQERLTFVRPTENFAEGRRYVVGIRNVVDGAGTPLPPSDVFRAYRDDLSTNNAAVEARRGRMESIFTTLGNAGVARDDLIMAWDFTVASRRNLSERLLAMRDDAFAQLGDAAPAFTVDSVVPSTRANLAREVTGTYQVPNYLTGTGGPGEVMNNGTGPGASPIPARNGTLTARFICTIPTSATNADGSANPSGTALYGHGLLGSAREVYGSGSRYASATNTTFCATWSIGMSEDDIAPVLAALNDMTAFRSMADRLQQGALNYLFLGRLLKHPEGFASDPAFQAADGHPVIDGTRLSYVGVSQGGILGGAISAVAQDWERSFLGVGGINYSTLLDRSVDFDVFATVFDPRYPDWVDRQQAILLMQMLWDRGEGNGYAHHLVRRPYPNTPAKRVMLYEAFGDHQVANIATEVLARTIDAEVRWPALAPGRSPDVEPYWDLDRTTRFPDRRGSYLVVWDFGTPAPPTENLPNRAGQDPHGLGRDQAEVLAVSTAFLNEGVLVDTCAGGPCQTAPPPS
jgi:hypothetical protein